MVAQKRLRYKLLQNLTQVSCISSEISFLTTTTMGAGAAQIPENFQRVLWGHLFHSFSPWKKQVGELQTVYTARRIYIADNSPKRVVISFCKNTNSEGAPINELCIQAAILIVLCEYSVFLCPATHIPFPASLLEHICI